MKGALRRHATTLLLLALAIAAGIVLTLDRGWVSTDEAAERKKTLFPVWRGEDITEFTVTFQGHTARLQRAASNDGGARSWNVDIDGTTYPADEQTVEQYLGRLEFATPVRTASQAVVDAGLDAPRLTIAVTMGERTTHLALGGAAPTPAGAVYARVETSTFVISPELAAALDVDPQSFRSRRFVPYVSVDVRAIHLDGEGGSRHLVRAPWSDDRAAGFRFDGSSAEGTVRVASDEMEKVWGAIGQLTAEAFLSDEEADRALEPRVTLTFLPKDEKLPRGVVDLGGACPKKEGSVVAVRREPTRSSVCVGKALFDALTRSASDLVDTSIVAGRIDGITEVRIVEGDKKLEMARKGDGWHLRSPRDEDVSASAGRKLLESLLRVEGRIAAVAGNSPPTDGPERAAAEQALASPRATLSVVSVRSDAPSDREERKEDVVISSPRGETTYVRRAEDGAILAVPSGEAAALVPNELALRSEKVIDEPLERFRALRVEEPSAGRIQRVERADSGAWELRAPKGDGLRADIGLATELAARLGSLTAERWVRATDDGSFGLSHPRLTIEAQLDGDSDAGGTTAIRLRLGAATDQGSFAQLDGDPAVFVAPPALEAAATRWMLDRSVFLFAVTSVGRVTLSAPPKKPVVAERTEPGWRIAGTAATDGAASSRAATIRDALADLVPEAAVSIGPPLTAQGFDHAMLDLSIEFSGGEPPVHVRIGAGDTFRGVRIYYARRDGVDATYAVAQAKVAPLLAAL